MFKAEIQWSRKIKCLLPGTHSKNVYISQETCVTLCSGVTVSPSSHVKCMWKGSLLWVISIYPKMVLGEKEKPSGTLVCSYHMHGIPSTIMIRQKVLIRIFNELNEPIYKSPTLWYLALAARSRLRHHK